MKYFSEKTNKVYEKVEDLKKAEVEFDKAHAAEQRKKEVRAKRAKEVEEAYKAVNVAQKKADELLKEFVKDYGAYHTSINEVPANNLLDFIFNPFSW